ncbi:hypothetical protein BDP27DRAFT_1327429 [Rhodocollybia butyracea]|uniref:DUF6534 domain-containing protein n=1 Tax=Rhodocollybia butyracea TaxID=206335 RepID=A0A9P5PRY1_9AGAR|nr:hypothetical protein BDP27DRAFT_1327429 [Rhodocollybia butyracea]
MTSTGTQELASLFDISPAYILTGIWINLLFYSLELLVGSAKVVMAMALLVDAAGTFSTCKLAWLVRYLKSQRVSFAEFITTGVATAISAFTEQWYFVYRLWAITESKGTMAVTSPLVLSSFIYVISSVAKPTLLSMRVSVCLLAGTDVAIAIHVMYALRRLNFLQNSNITQSLVHKVIAYAIASGTLTALFTIIAAITTLIPLPGVFIIFYYCAGRVYTLTILLNFVFFHEWRKSAKTKQRSRENSDRCTPRFWSRPFTQPTHVREPPVQSNVFFGGAQAPEAEAERSKHESAREYNKPVAGPPFSVDAIFKTSGEEM